MAKLKISKQKDGNFALAKRAMDFGDSITLLKPGRTNKPQRFPIKCR